MHSATDTNTAREPLRIPVWLGLCLFLGIAVFVLWEEHKAYFLGALPYVLLALSPIIHLLMHRDHGRGPHDAGHTLHHPREGGAS